MPLVDCTAPQHAGLFRYDAWADLLLAIRGLGVFAGPLVRFRDPRVCRATAARLVSLVHARLVAPAVERGGSGADDAAVAVPGARPGAAAELRGAADADTDEGEEGLETEDGAEGDETDGGDDPAAASPWGASAGRYRLVGALCAAITTGGSWLSSTGALECLLARPILFLLCSQRNISSSAAEFA